MFDEMRNAVKRGGLVAAANSDPQTKADAGHVGHFGRGDGQPIFKPGDLVHATLPYDSGHARGEPGAALIFENDLNSFFGIISQCKKLVVIGADETFLS